MRATWTSYNFRRTHYSEKLFERDSFGLIWNFAFTFHGLNNFRLLTRGGPRDPLLRYSWLFNYTPCFARSFFSPKLYRDSFFVDIEEIEPGRRINREGEGRDGKKFKSRGKKTVKLGYEGVALNRCYSKWMFSPFFPPRLGLNTVETLSNLKLVETRTKRRDNRQPLITISPFQF